MLVFAVSSDGPVKSGGRIGEEEPWEKEVEDLVEWSNKLDEEQL